MKDIVALCTSELNLLPDFGLPLPRVWPFPHGPRWRSRHLQPKLLFRDIREEGAKNTFKLSYKIVSWNLSPIIFMYFTLSRHSQITTLSCKGGWEM